jgi:Zn-dependent peptidase ImmA (M78 family)
MAARRPVLSYAREADIASVADSLSRHHSSHGRVDPHSIASANGISYRCAAFPEEFDGLLVHDAGEFFIILNDRRAPHDSPRGRFTFAHELGHYFLHRERLVRGKWPSHLSRTEFATDSLLEAEADHFAAVLLMPEHSFRSAFRDSAGPILPRIASAAQHFGTSLTAATYRALALGLVPRPAAVFQWDKLGQLRGRRMSTETALLRREYRLLAAAPPSGSITAASIAALRVGQHRGRSPLMHWFPHLSGYDSGDHALLDEEVCSLGEHGWMTLVSASPGPPHPV